MVLVQYAARRPGSTRGRPGTQCSPCSSSLSQHDGIRQREPELGGDLQLSAGGYRGNPELQLPKPR